MTKYELQERTKKFHIDVIKLCGLFLRMPGVSKQQNNSSGQLDQLEEIVGQLVEENQVLILSIRLK